MDILLADVVSAVRSAGALIREAWDRPRHIRHKGRIDLVTETDVAVEAFLTERLKALVPSADSMAEESSASVAEPAGECWIVDPLDGTTNFVHGIPQVAVSVALWRDGRPDLGVVFLPLFDECFAARRGHGATLNGRPIHVSPAAALSDSLVATGFPYDVPPNLPRISYWLERVLPATQGLRRIGSAAADLAYVACGRLDAYYEACLKPWDFAAGWLLVEEAGGRVTGTDGRPVRFDHPLLATNSLLHENMLELLAGAPEPE